MKDLSPLRHPYRISWALLICFVLLALTGCNRGWDSDDSSTPNEPDDDYIVYTGPGSSWTLSLEKEDDNFTLERRNAPGDDDDWNGEVGGTYEVSNSSGFLELTVVTSGESGLAVDQKLFGIRVSDELTLLKPFFDTISHPIALVKTGCPTETTQTGSWISFKGPATTNTEKHNGNHYGNYKYGKMDDEYKLSVDPQFNLSDPLADLGGQTIAEGTCDDGLVTIAERQIYFSTGGSMVMELANSESELSDGNTQDAEFLLGLEQRALTSLADFDGTYIGLFSNTALAASARNFGVKSECGDGSCEITLFSDIAAGNESTIYTLDLANSEKGLNQPTAGYIVGSLSLKDSTDDGATMTCSINSDYADSTSGDNFIACVGLAPGSDSEYINVFLVTK